MKMFCPYCDEEHDVQSIEQNEIITVRGENFSAKVLYYRCPKTGEEFETSDSPYDPYADAYRQYREKNHLLSPEEIRAFRHEYELTQKELSDLLGWGAVTLSRYENGSLQDEAHDNLLQLIRDNPDSFLKQIERNSDALSEDKKQRITSILKGKRGTRETTLECVDRKLSAVEPGIFNGFKRFNIEKFMGAVEFFCSGEGIYRTKLNKLLYFADKLHFQKYSVSLTGAQYAHAPYGPVPNKYKTLIGIMEDALSILESQEITFPGQDYTGEIVKSASEEHLNSLSVDEMKTLKDILEKYCGISSLKLSEISHLESAYQYTRDGELISFISFRHIHNN